MKKEMLYDAIGGVDEALVEGAANRRKKKHTWLKWASAAACLVLVAVAGFGLTFGRMGASAPNNSGASMEGSGGFDFYSGPILPLTTLEEGHGLTAERELTFDFGESVYQPAYTDRYVLTNPTDTDVTVTLLYPFVSSLNGLDQYTPALTVDGQPAETGLLVGDYTGGFRGVDGEDQGSWNLDGLSGFEGYQALLSDGSYLAAALGPHVDLSAVPVTVYEFANAWGPEETKSILNPTIRACFDLDYDKTTVLSYGFHGGLYDREKGTMGRSFSIGQPGERYYGRSYYLIVAGEDIENLTTQGYATGGWDTQKTIEFGVDITRTETDLDSALRQVFALMSDNWGLSDGERELWYALFCDYLAQYGELEGYSDGMLGGADFQVVDRVCWLTAEVTVPAGGSMEVTASGGKESSLNYPGKGGDKELYGFEFATTLGSSLTFTRQTAALANGEGIALTEQNLGLDPGAGITTAELDLTVERYYFNAVYRAAE